MSLSSASPPREPANIHPLPPSLWWPLPAGLALEAKSSVCFRGWFPGASQSASGGPGDHLSGSLVRQRPAISPPGPASGQQGRLRILLCPGTGASVWFLPTPHLEFLLVSLPASRAGPSCLVRFHLHQGLRSAASCLWEPDPSDRPSRSPAGLLAHSQVARWPHPRGAPCPLPLGLHRCCLAGGHRASPSRSGACPLCVAGAGGKEWGLFFVFFF